MAWIYSLVTTARINQLYSLRYNTWLNSNLLVQVTCSLLESSHHYASLSILPFKFFFELLTVGANVTAVLAGLSTVLSGSSWTNWTPLSLEVESAVESSRIGWRRQFIYRIIIDWMYQTKHWSAGPIWPSSIHGRGLDSQSNGYQRSLQSCDVSDLEQERKYDPNMEIWTQIARTKSAQTELLDLPHRYRDGLSQTYYGLVDTAMISIPYLWKGG